MMNYFFYKMYKAFLKSSIKDIAIYAAAVFMGALLGVNVLVVSAFLAKSDIATFLFSSSFQAGMFSFLLIGVAVFYYSFKDKYKHVIERYSNESNSQRIWGNILITLYIMGSFASIFAVGLYKPGYLPK